MTELNMEKEMKMTFNKILDKIPDYKEFMTVAELDKSSRKLAEKYENVKLINA